MSPKNNIALIKAKIAYNIAFHRVQKGYSARGLAKEIGVGEKMIRRWESDDYIFMPTISSLIKVANVLNIDLTELIN